MKGRKKRQRIRIILLHDAFAVDMLLQDQLWSMSHFDEKDVYMGRRLSMFSMDESVDVRPFPLSVTRSLMRMLGLLVAAEDVGGGGVLPSLRGGGGGGCRTLLGCGGAE